MNATGIFAATVTSCAALLLVGCAGQLEGSLNGTEWTVQYLHYHPVPSQPQLTLAFSNEGKISGSAGCNPWWSPS
jgi:heat shock protein HslJ